MTRIRGTFQKYALRQDVFNLIHQIMEEYSFDEIGFCSTDGPLDAEPLVTVYYYIVHKGREGTILNDTVFIRMTDVEKDIFGAGPDQEYFYLYIKDDYVTGSFATEVAYNDCLEQWEEMMKEYTFEDTKED